MAPERRLIPPDFDSRCTSNVVGVIPPKVRDFLAAAAASGAHDNDDPGSRRPPLPPPSRRGRVDDHSSGASFLLGRSDSDNDNDNVDADVVVVVWEHSSQTPNEELIAPISGVYANLVHPEHSPGRDLLVACLGPDPANDNDGDNDDVLAAKRGGGDRSRRRRGGGGGRSSSSASPRRAYVASPATGVLCVWILDDDDYDNNDKNNDKNDHRVRTRGAAKATRGGGGGGTTTTKECDASVRLRLRDDEYLTDLVPMLVAKKDGRGGGGGGHWLIVSTNRGRLWKVRTTYRPMTLHARLVEGGTTIGGEGDDDDAPAVVPATTTKAVGVVRGLYNYLTTPSKSRDGGVRGDGNATSSRTGGSDDVHDANDDDDIVALVPLPQKTTSSSSSSSRGDGGGGGGRKSPGRGPAGTAPPRKQQRLLHPSSYVDVPPNNTRRSRVVSMTKSMALTGWIVSTSADDDDDDVDDIDIDDEIDGVVRGEGRAYRTCPFPRRRDGTLDLSALLPPPPTSDDDDADAMEGEEGRRAAADPLEGYRRLDVLASPVLAGDGSSMIVVIRVARDDDDDDDVDGSATRAYVVRIGLAPGGAPYVVDAAWLDRHSGPSLSNSDGLACVGLSVAEEEEEEEEDEGGAVGPGDDDDDGTIVVSGSVAYVGFGPRGDRGDAGGGEGGGRQFPVTVSAIHFPPVGVATTRERRRQPRVKDLDLHSSIVPAVVRDSMSYDPLTGGCVFLATTGLLCGAHVRFPIVARRRPASSSSSSSSAEGPPNDLLRPTSSLLLLAQDEAVLTIKSHLQSSFRQYLVKLKEAGGCGGNPARAVVAPSVGTCPSRVLSAAVVLASNDYACAPGGAAFSPGVATIGGGSPVTALRDKLRLHRDFVTFLVHAGAYRRVSTAGRVRLRDHGELITATRAMLIECQGHFSKAEAAVGRGGGGGGVEGDTGRRSELARARQMVMSALEGASDDVTALPHRWAGLQQLAYSSGNSPLLGNDILLLLTSASICEGIGQALRYRQNESSPLYDIPSYDSLSSTSTNYLPWTSSTSMLDVLFAQLRSIQQWGESILSTSVDYETETANLRRYVEDLSASALSGHRDALSREEPDNDVALKSSYEEAKYLAVSLLRKFANDQGDDLVALQTSLEHSHFEGIVQICHDHRQSWRFQGPFADHKADERYDLQRMIINSSSDSSYAHLHQTRDHQTGLSFCSYVLRWYADRGIFPEVFELGKHCHNDLTRYVRNDERLSNLAWIQHLRVGGHEQATVGLLGLTSPVLFGKESVMSLWEKDQMLSLAKLSNKLAGAKSASRTTAHDQRTKTIENSLTLVSAQKILQENAELGDEIALNENDILRLAVEKIQSSQDMDEIKRFAICGLSVASAKSPDQFEAMASDASSIWHAVIQADIDKWQNVANVNSMAVGGIEEEELIHIVEGTAFVGVLYDFVTTSGGEMLSVGFGCDHVRNQVMHALGSDELAKVLMLSADVVAAAK